MSEARTRGTPLEIYLAALRYECCIFLFVDFEDGSQTLLRFAEQSHTEFSPVACLQCSFTRPNRFHFQWYAPTFPIYKLEICAERDSMLSLAACIHASLSQDDVRPASTPRDFSDFKSKHVPDGLAPEPQDFASKIAEFYHVRVEFYDRSPLYAPPIFQMSPVGIGDPTVMIFDCGGGLPYKWISKRFSKERIFEKRAATDGGGSDKLFPDGRACVAGAADSGASAGGSYVAVEEGDGLSRPDNLTGVFQTLFSYPDNFELFLAVLTRAASKKDVKNLQDFYTCFRFIQNKTPLIPCHAELFKDFLAKNSSNAEESSWDAIKTYCLSGFQKADSVKRSAHPLSSFILWITTHCRIQHDCRGAEIIQNFLKRKAGSFRKMVQFLRILLQYRTRHQLEKDDFTKQTQQVHCMFEGHQHDFLFSLLDCESPNALSEFAALQLESSLISARWLRRNTGRSYKLWGHVSEHEYDRCEVQKCSSKSEKWRHMIYAYAIMALLWSQYNGNKEGPIGDYPDRRGSELGRMVHPDLYKSLLDQISACASGDRALLPESLQPLLQELQQAQFVFPSKQGEKPADYHGHNIVALAVGKRGDILRIAYNHNTLFCSTVDHAEERLIDGLYKDPEAFVQKSHARIYDPSAVQKQTMEVEKHMQHISVYTSLEQCQQCAGKFHLALVPEVIFCQRDWEIQLLQEKLYEQHHKCRPIPASFFGFPHYEELAMSYINYCERIDASGDSGVVFFQYGKPGETAVPAVKGKKTMPYFLCSNEAQQIFRRGSIIFHKVLLLLFHSDQRNRPLFTNDIETLKVAWFERAEHNVTVTKDDAKSLIEAYNLDVSDWVTTPQRLVKSSSKPNDSMSSVPDSPCSASPSCVGSLDFENDQDADEIRNYRPSLKSKQNRLWQDELTSRRKRWIENTFKQKCTLKFFFDRYAVIDELAIDRNIGPLGEIRSIYLGRASSGATNLKGTFTVTFSSINVAEEVKECFRNVALTKSGMIFMKKESVVTPEKRLKIENAAKWLYLNREPNECEFFVPEGVTCPSLFGGCLVESTSAGNMERQYPGQKYKTKVQVLKFGNISSKRKIQNYFFGQPRIIFSHSLHGHQPESMQDGSAAMNLSLISRIDVSEGELLELLRKCVRLNALKEFPPHYRFSSSKLTTCNSMSTLKWLNFVARNQPLEGCPQVVDCMVMDWKLWNIKFMTTFDFDVKNIQSSLAHLGTNKFCQPYPQCVFDFAFYMPSPESDAEVNRPFSIRWNPLSVPTWDSKFDKLPNSSLFCLTIVMDKSLNQSRKNSRIFPSKEDSKAELNFMVKKDNEEYSFYLRTDKVPINTERQIKVDENFVATMIVSDMLESNGARIPEDIKHLWANWERTEFVSIPDDFVSATLHDFWGNDIQHILKWPRAANETKKTTKPCERLSCEDFFNMLKCAKQNNTFGFYIQGIFSDVSHKIDFGNRMQTDRAELCCRYCGIRTVFTGVSLLCTKDECCIGHFTQDRKRDEILSFGKFVTFLEDNREYNEANNLAESTSKADVKVKSKVNATIERIGALESQLGLSFTVQSCVSLHNVMKDSEAVQKLSKDEDDEKIVKSVKTDLPQLHLTLHRDTFYGPARVAFRIDNVPDIEHLSVKIQLRSDDNMENTDTVLFDRLARVAAGQDSDCRLYGKLSLEKGDVGDVFDEGGVISATALRYFFEPEYFPDHFLRGYLEQSYCRGSSSGGSGSDGMPSDGGSGGGSGGGGGGGGGSRVTGSPGGVVEADSVSMSHSSRAFPFINVICDYEKPQNKHSFQLRVHSWNIEELQSHPLRKLLQSLKELQMQRFKLQRNEEESLRIEALMKSWPTQSQWYIHCNELQKRKTLETILFAKLVHVSAKGANSRM